MHHRLRPQRQRSPTTATSPSTSPSTWAEPKTTTTSPSIRSSRSTRTSAADAHDLALRPRAACGAWRLVIRRGGRRRGRRRRLGRPPVSAAARVQITRAQDEIGIGAKPFAQLAAGQLLAVDRHGAVPDLNDADARVGLPWNQADAVLQRDHVVALAQAVAELGHVARWLRVEREIERRKSRISSAASPPRARSTRNRRDSIRPRLRLASTCCTSRPLISLPPWTVRAHFVAQQPLQADSAAAPTSSSPINRECHLGRDERVGDAGGDAARDRPPVGPFLQREDSQMTRAGQQHQQRRPPPEAARPRRTRPARTASGQPTDGGEPGPRRAGRTAASCADRRLGDALIGFALVQGSAGHSQDSFRDRPRRSFF